jgi:hypothetical protein
VGSRCADRRAAPLIGAMLLVVLGRGNEARAEDFGTQAREHMSHGTRLYREGRFQEAIAEYLAGYTLEPRIEFLYNLGQAERRRGDCAQSLVYFHQAEARDPSPELHERIRFQIERCAAPAPTRAQPQTPPPASDPHVDDALELRVRTLEAQQRALIDDAEQHRRSRRRMIIGVSVAGTLIVTGLALGLGLGLGLNAGPDYTSTTFGSHAATR